MRLVKYHLIRPISIAYDIPGVTVSIVKDDKLIIEHSRHGNITLLANPSTKPDEKPMEFLGDQWFASKLVFDTDKSGSISGFRVSGSRVKNLSFRKL
jgi:hypothetical protein